MELEFKPDFGQARERWDRFWKGECTDRPNLAIYAPAPGAEPVEKPHPYEIHEIGVEAYADKIEAWARSQEFLGEAMPFCQLSYGADHLALLMGADLTLSGDIGTGKARSAWTHHFLDSYDMELALKPESKWYERTFKDLAYLRKRFEGRLLLTSSEFSGGLDTLSAIRGQPGTAGGCADGARRCVACGGADRRVAARGADADRRGVRVGPLGIDHAAWQLCEGPDERAPVRFRVHDRDGLVRRVRGAEPGAGVRAVRRRRLSPGRAGVDQASGVGGGGE